LPEPLRVSKEICEEVLKNVEALLESLSKLAKFPGSPEAPLSLQSSRRSGNFNHSCRIAEYAHAPPASIRVHTS
jgi:hypothetical protein